MEQMTRNQASTVFQARTRMLDVKNNFRNKYKDVICRFCAIDIETQEHVLEKCIDIHVDDTTQKNSLVMILAKTLQKNNKH